MSATGDGISDFMASAVLAPVTSYSYAFWYLPDHVPNTVDTRQPFSMTNHDAPEGTYDVTFVWDYPDAAVYKGTTHRESGGTYKRCQIASTPGSGQYVHIAVTYDATNIKMYYKGALEATTAAATPATSRDPNINVCSWSSTVAFDTASIAELCVWNTGLTAANIKSLADGAVPNTIANGNVIFYHTLNTGASTTTGPALTNNGATLNVSHILGSTGGIVYSGVSTTTTTVYSLTNAGGMVFGANDSGKIFGKSWSTGVAVGTTVAPAPHLRQATHISSTFLPTTYRGSIASAINVASRFLPVTNGILVSGRTMGNDH